MVTILTILVQTAPHKLHTKFKFTESEYFPGVPPPTFPSVNLGLILVNSSRELLQAIVRVYSALNTAKGN